MRVQEDHQEVCGAGPVNRPAIAAACDPRITRTGRGHTPSRVSRQIDDAILFQKNKKALKNV